MKNNNQPILTIGIIFKNEIQCLERCLKSLSTLRKTISCELVMADTGSNDGSRSIAMRYADVLFDFPWIDDFAAARNAVMDKAKGQWHMYIDTDEYLDGDISELINFLQNSDKYTENLCGFTIRNYESYEKNNKYSDFTAIRLIRTSLGVRFHGTIHEAWDVEEDDLQNIRFFSRTILHHEGYIGLNDIRGKEKRERNLALIRQLYSEHPQDLKVLLQYIESAKAEPEYLEIIHHACIAVESKQQGWQNLGAPIFRYAAYAALEEGLPEFEEWVAKSELWFPDSPFTQIDIKYMIFLYEMKRGNYFKSIDHGEDFLLAMNNLHNSVNARVALAYSTLLVGSPYWEQEVKIYLADMYAKTENPKCAQKHLKDINISLLDYKITEIMLLTLGDLHRLSMFDTVPLINAFFDSLESKNPSEIQTSNCLNMFYHTAAIAFLTENINEERRDKNFCRPSYTLFLPLADRCEIGLAAAILETDNLETIQQLLFKVKNWERLPIEALSHALELGTPFPLPQKSLKAEEMERLAARLSESTEDYVSWLMDIFGNAFDGGKQNSSLQSLVWQQYLILVAVRSFGWKTDQTDKGIELAKLFSKSEKEYLAHFYAPELLCPENLALLPALHRFGWHCARAFKSLDAGDSSAYVRELKAGLEVCPEANAIAEYLIKYTPQLKPCRQDVSEELLNLAEQVRKMLSSYPPNHPAVAAIKSSEAYQKVAELIENEHI